MSIFKSKWIIIKIEKISWKNLKEDIDKDKIKPWEFLYTIFTKDYWKIKCNKKLSKQEKTLDLWYVINFEIRANEKSSIHKINNIKILSEFNHENKTFREINDYLVILALVLNKTPNGTPIFELFDLLEIITSTNDITEIKLVLTRLKILWILWELDENNSNETVKRILKFINANKIEKILKLTWINDEIKSILLNIDF